MEQDIAKFRHFMRQRGYINPFTLYRNQLIALAVNRSLDECLHKLAKLDADEQLRNRSEYTLKTDVRSPVKGKPISCTFFFRHDNEEGFRIYKLRIDPPENLGARVREIAHNMEIPRADTVTHLFPQLKRIDQRYPPFGRGR